VRGALALLALLALLAAGCGDADADDSSSKDAKRDAAKTTTTDSDEPAADDEQGEATKLPEPVPAGEQPPIVISSPDPFAQLVGSFILQGEASVHEGALTWAILDAKLKPMVTGHITATCGAPCRGRFRMRISLRNVPIGSWELHVWSPNVADSGPARLHDTMVPVSVSDQRTPGQPDPNAAPPGGPPQIGGGAG
jgi:hypothetical protein